MIACIRVLRNEARDSDQLDWGERLHTSESLISIGERVRFLFHQISECGEYTCQMRLDSVIYCILILEELWETVVLSSQHRNAIGWGGILNLEDLTKARENHLEVFRARTIL
jgi:hypothetical protein